MNVHNHGPDDGHGMACVEIRSHTGDPVGVCTLRPRVACINWSGHDVPHAVVYLHRPGFPEMFGRPAYFKTHAEAFEWAVLIAESLEYDNANARVIQGENR